MKKFLATCVFVSLLASSAYGQSHLYEKASENLMNGNYVASELQYAEACKTGELPACDMVAIAEYGWNKKSSYNDAVKWSKILLASKKLHGYGMWVTQQYINFYKADNIDTTQLKQLLRRYK